MKRLSDIQIGSIRRLLARVLDFVPGPAPLGGPDEVRRWCHDVCAAETPREVAERWAGHVTELGGYLLTVGLAETLWERRPASASDLLLVRLSACEEFAVAVLCLAADKAEGEDLFRRARLAAQLGEEFPEPDRERAARLVVETWQITDVLGNMLVVDPDTLRRFKEAIRAAVEGPLTDAAANPPQEAPPMARTAPRPPTSAVDVDRIVAESARRQSLREELDRVEQRMQRRLGEVVRAMARFDTTLPDVAAHAEGQPSLGPGQQEALADELLALCSTIRETQFTRGMELLLESAAGQGDNYRLAVRLYDLGWAGDRTAVVGLLQQLERLPRRADPTAAGAASQQGVWLTVKNLYGFIVRWPDLSPRPHPWHPDQNACSRLAGELAGLSGDPCREADQVTVPPAPADRSAGPPPGPTPDPPDTIVSLGGAGTHAQEEGPGQDDNDDPDEAATPTSVGDEKRAVNWAHFAIGKGSRGNWQHFRFRQGRWQHFGRLDVRSGKQEQLLDLFLKGGGCLREDDALKLWYEPKSESQRQEILSKLEPEMTHLRKLIRQARGVAGRTSDPLPRSKDDGPRRWIAAIQFGGAGHQDGDFVSDTHPIHFIPADYGSLDD